MGTCWNSQGVDTDKFDTDSTYILVRNDFDILHMTSGFENLSKHILCDPRIEPSNVQRAFVRFGCRPSSKATGTAR
jgi:hypothetical protein